MKEKLMTERQMAITSARQTLMLRETDLRYRERNPSSCYSYTDYLRNEISDLKAEIAELEQQTGWSPPYREKTDEDILEELIERNGRTMMR